MATKTKPASINIEGMQPPKISGIVINRDRPKGSGWCGNENCKHASHKYFNES